MILVIDNYDSFTYNLVHYLNELGAETVVQRNDALTVDQALALKPQGVLLSPGPCTPNEAGVCLGHQSIGQAYGGDVVRAKTLMHGKTSLIQHAGKGLFQGVKNPFTATRYHSLTVLRDTLPDSLEITAWTDDGEIMGLQHKTRPVHGVQFHPESIATECGHDLLANFLAIAGVKPLARA
jgi:anthranilate synthase component 2